MNRDHALIDELLAIQALDGLDEPDVALLERERAEHGDCDECRRLEAEHAEVAGILALALEPRPVDDAVAERILATPQGRSGTAAAPADELSARRDARLRRWQAGFGVAAAVALVLAIALAAGPDGGPTVPGSTIVAFDGAPGELAVAYTPGERGLLVWGTGLPDPAAGNVYELWMIDGGRPVRGACLSPTDGAVAAFVDADPSSAGSLAVTVESAACPDQPTTEPVYTADLA